MDVLDGTRLMERWVSTAAFDVGSMDMFAACSPTVRHRTSMVLGLNCFEVGDDDG